MMVIPTTYNGAYSYDGVGRLSQVVDSATSVTENYTWNADGTLASSPGPSYTRNFVYDEEGRLLSIARGSTVAFQYGYAYDGGRRWRKDIANAVWTWYPCGVACSAGELVEQTSDLTGNTWTNSASYLRGSSCSGGLIRRNSEYHHADIIGNFGVITNGSGSILSNNLYDTFGVQRNATGTAQTQQRFDGAFLEEDGLIATSGAMATIYRGVCYPFSGGIRGRRSRNHAGLQLAFHVRSISPILSGPHRPDARLVAMPILLPVPNRADLVQYAITPA